VLAIASGAAVAAKSQMHSRYTSVAARTKRRSLAQAPRSAHLPSHISAARFTAENLCLLKHTFNSVSGAAATREAVPAFAVGSGGGVVKACSSSFRWRFSGRTFFPWPLGHQLCSLRAVLPNPSLEWTAPGKALGPRTGQCHHPSRGPSAFPASAPQLKR
jgi:hypothetical protein